MALAAIQPQQVIRVTTGVSTWVYRIATPRGICYLRVLPEAGASFAPEVFVHQELRTREVTVPEVLGWEEYHPAFKRSIMLTAELAGVALADCTTLPDQAAILIEVGRALAQMSALPVAGFGWIDRTPQRPAGLRAPFSSAQAWLEDELREPLEGLAADSAFGGSVTKAVQIALGELAERLGEAPACLAHGDLDPTHIFVAGEHYSGLIDFGEIRGAHQCYDLGHFAVSHPDLLPPLLAGYTERATLPADATRQIALTALLIAARRVGRRLWASRAPYPPDIEALHRWAGHLTARSGG
jgi:Ser/Thr protein kinase RdoA (MazF antagonist)